MTLANDAVPARLGRILAFAAVVEGVTGLASLLVPALVIRGLFGVEVEGASLALGRVCGIALIALGWACWPGGRGLQGTMKASRAMLIYNALIALYLAWVGLAHPPAGFLLWPAVVLHAVVAALLLHAARTDT
ncbi:hypothetical protein QTH97_36625 [Variovorax sp. J22R24]|uniref:hypothetical protein n=1 Tax=Variovorax gracilis TaxID=3053502 RepID=UPI0025763E27|nr:hypothetical protein [Variovorax sp. J22R24]MDM0110452.1 hypothetical protein [Variovorax sp. J22R24]